MAQNARVEIKGLDKLLNGLVALGDMREVKHTIYEMAMHLKNEIADYPAQKYVSIAEAGGWASEKQRIYVIAMLASGQFDSPYRRGQSDPSEDLGQKWNVKIVEKGFGARVGNNVSYGPYVQDADQQSKMMELRGWKTTDEVAEEETDFVVDSILDAIDKELKKI